VYTVWAISDRYEFLQIVWARTNVARKRGDDWSLTTRRLSKEDIISIVTRAKRHYKNSAVPKKLRVLQFGFAWSDAAARAAERTGTAKRRGLGGACCGAMPRRPGVHEGWGVDDEGWTLAAANAAEGSGDAPVASAAAESRERHMPLAFLVERLATEWAEQAADAADSAGEKNSLHTAGTCRLSHATMTRGSYSDLWQLRNHMGCSGEPRMTRGGYLLRVVGRTTLPR
jgi:hypothetical protein